MPISIRGRRSRKEGWAADIGEEVAPPNPRERLANNTPLWIICAVVVMLLSAALIAISGRHSSQDTGLLKPLVPGDTAKGFYTDEAHNTFIEKLVTMARKRGVDLDAEFTSDSEFKIIVPSDIGFDEIAYLSRFSALGIKRFFGNGAIIYAYARDSKRPDKLRLTATTQWSGREYNFVTKAERTMNGE